MPPDGGHKSPGYIGVAKNLASPAEICLLPLQPIIVLGSKRRATQLAQAQLLRRGFSSSAIYGFPTF
jgi:hypothetical protein